MGLGKSLSMISLIAHDKQMGEAPRTFSSGGATILYYLPIEQNGIRFLLILMAFSVAQLGI